MLNRRKSPASSTLQFSAPAVLSSALALEALSHTTETVVLKHVVVGQLLVHPHSPPGEDPDANLTSGSITPGSTTPATTPHTTTGNPPEPISRKGHSHGNSALHVLACWKQQLHVACLPCCTVLAVGGWQGQQQTDQQVDMQTAVTRSMHIHQLLGRQSTNFAVDATPAPIRPNPPTHHFCVSQLGSQQLLSSLAWLPFLRASMNKPGPISMM
jgi:hypothetical protein